ELEADFGVPVTDLHRPYIDELERPNPDDPSGESTMRRIPDVLDVWFDSGSMPFAQVHYPFENTDWFEHHFPGDFIVEYIGQTRGWFYTLHVLSTAIFDRPAFSSAVSHGIVLGDDGRKASKSLRNYPDPLEMYDKYGSDAARWTLMSSPVLRGGNLGVAEGSTRHSVRHVLLPPRCPSDFLPRYAGARKVEAGPVAPERIAGMPAMDRYVLARTRELAEQVAAHLDAYEIASACELVRDHIDVLTNWYVRTQRDRFWAEDDDAFDTLWTVLETLTRVMAPLAPLVTEEIWRGLTGGRSVHLTDWPQAAALGGDADLVAAMERTREVVSTALSLRKAAGLRVRQPLLSATAVVPGGLDEHLAELAARELNVREVRVVDLDSLTEEEVARFGVTTTLTVNARAAGPRLGRTVQQVIRAAKAGAWSQDAEGAVVV